MARLIPNLFAASAARTTTGQGSGVYLGPAAESIAILTDVSAASGTTPTLDLTVEWSNDGTTWAQGDTADSFTQITTTGTVVKSFTVKGIYARLVWTIGGGTPSFTFSSTGTFTGVTQE